MTLPDRSRSRAVLLGTWSYTDPHLPDIDPARHSLAQMHEVLVSDLCGWPGECVTVIENPARPADLPDQLVQTFAEATDVALFYFVGHGLLDDENGLCLCLGDSVTQASRRGTTSLQFRAVRNALRHSDARVRIVILDCCYSGRAADPPYSLSAGPADLADEAAAAGAYTIAASGAYDRAGFEPEGSDGQEALTYFTKFFVTTIRTGIAGERGWLGLNEIFNAVHRSLRLESKPEPTRRMSHTADEFVFARNVALQGPPTDRSPDVSELRARLASATASQQNMANEIAGLKALVAAMETAGTHADDPPGEPPEQRLEPEDQAQIARMSAEVLVIDGRPRYHRAGCAHLAGRPTDALPVREATELGFTPCGLCDPAGALLNRLPRVIRLEYSCSNCGFTANTATGCPNCGYTLVQEIAVLNGAITALQSRQNHMAEDREALRNRMQEAIETRSRLQRRP